jgi:hypothetical protein
MHEHRFSNAPGYTFEQLAELHNTGQRLLYGRQHGLRAGRRLLAHQSARRLAKVGYSAHGA